LFWRIIDELVCQGLALLLDGKPEVQVVREVGDWTTMIKLIEELALQVVIMDNCLQDTNGVEATIWIASGRTD
jgi:DNA-binding NarL/FixJ family response regulator